MHKLAGRAALLFALVNISLGVFMAVMPLAAWAAWFGLLGVLILLYIGMEIRLQVQTRRTVPVTFPMQDK